MSWARRLVGIARGEDAPPAGKLPSLLGSIYVALTNLSEQVQGHAKMAPTVSLEGELAQLGDEVAIQAERIGTLLSERNLTRPKPSGAAPAAQPSHWARLVQDLELAREAHRQLVDAYAELNQVDPALAAEVEDCAYHVVGYLHRLRSLIARADPQALN